MPTLLLASASPRRIELCERLGLDVKIQPVDVEDPPRSREDPAFYVQRMARKKADAITRQVAKGRPWAIAADTVVVAPGRKILGKPRDRPDAKRMLKLLMGESHHVLTGLCVARTGGPRRTKVVDTLVVFRQAGDAEILDYLGTKEWKGKAGGYAIQGIGGARFCTQLVGSFTNVIGLPTVELLETLKELDVL